MHSRRKLMIWSLGPWHFLDQRCAPIRCFTQRRKPRRRITRGERFSSFPNSRFNRAKKISSVALPSSSIRSARSASRIVQHRRRGLPHEIRIEILHGLANQLDRHFFRVARNEFAIGCLKNQGVGM